MWALARWLAEALKEPADEEQGRWDHVLELLTADFRMSPSLQDIAKEVGLTYETFRKRFHTRYGQAPLNYRNERRLEFAATLLRLTTLSCREIAESLGYTDEFHFSRRFKARFGTSPTHFRT